MATNESVENRRATPRQIIAALHVMLAKLPTDEADWVQRPIMIDGAIRALSSFGIDAETFVRYGMPSRAALPVFLAVVADEEPEDFPGLERWRQLLRVPRLGTNIEHATEEDAGMILQSMATIPHTLTIWAQNTPFEKLLTFEPPTDAEFEAYLLATPPAEETTSAYTWLWQRSVVDGLDRWTTESLHLEYLWHNGRRVALFPEEVLAADGPNSNLLNDEIALRAVRPRKHVTESADRLFWQLQEQAVEFLVKRKFTEAAALFEFHHRLHPDDARSINNLGFCRLPLNPESALHHLQRAEAAGYPQTAMNVYNQCCCWYSLNRSGEALDRAETYWQRQREPTEVGFIWEKGEDGWTLRPDADPERALAELAGLIAAELGLETRVARWSARLESISSTTASSS
jgi:hypothetical protein